MDDEANDELLKGVTGSPEYKELDPDTRRSVNGLLALIATGAVPPEQMAEMVLMTAIGVSLRDSDKLEPLIEGGVWHRKSTSRLVLIAGGWAWELGIELLGPQEGLDLDELEPM